MDKTSNKYKPTLSGKIEKIDISPGFIISRIKEVQEAYKAEISAKTKYYQKKYGFQIDTKNNKPGFHNDEGDAFRHTFSSADFYLLCGEAASTMAGILHEFTSPNDFDEWNMDSWNNNQGRQIAKEIKKEYGKEVLQKIPRQKLHDIIAERVVKRMHSGQLITHLDDKRLYKGKPEGLVRNISNFIHSPNKPEYINDAVSTEANKMSENLKRIIKEHEEETRRTFEENLVKLNIRRNTPIEEYERLTRKDRVFHQGDIPQIAKKASKDITQEELEDYKEFVKQWSRNGNKIPTQAELDERVARGELIWVEGYTKQDGTVVRGYFRHYPETV